MPDKEPEPVKTPKEDLIAEALAKRGQGVEWSRELKEKIFAESVEAQARYDEIVAALGAVPEKEYDPAALEADLKAGKIEQYARRGNTVRVCINGDWEQGVVKEKK